MGLLVHSIGLLTAVLVWKFFDGDKNRGQLPLHHFTHNNITFDLFSRIGTSAPVPAPLFASSPSPVCCLCLRGDTHALAMQVIGKANYHQWQGVLLKQVTEGHPDKLGGRKCVWEGSS